jgi:hypothetical protein
MYGDGSCECLAVVDAIGDVVRTPSIDWDVGVDVRVEPAFSRMASG